jgi:hypothetical protein
MKNNDLETIAKRSRNIILTVTAATAIAFAGCTKEIECSDGKDREGRPCQVQYVPGSGYHYFPQQYTGPYTSTSPRIGPRAIPAAGGGYTVAPSHVSRGGFGTSARGAGS